MNNKTNIEEDLYEKKIEYSELLSQSIVDPDEKLRLERIISRLTNQLKQLENK